MRGYGHLRFQIDLIIQKHSSLCTASRLGPSGTPPVNAALANNVIQKQNKSSAVQYITLHDPTN
jgi:hypothetical protein